MVVCQQPHHRPPPPPPEPPLSPVPPVPPPAATIRYSISVEQLTVEITKLPLDVKT